MIRFLITAVLTGLLFGILDGIINANPLAVKLMECYKPIAKTSINIPAGVIIDLVYGFVISGLFIVLAPALPAGSGILKGLIFGAGIWFFRVFMSVASSWMMYNIPVKTLVYTLLAGFIEMLILGALNGLLLKK